MNGHRCVHPKIRSILGLVIEGEEGHFESGVGGKEDPAGFGSESQQVIPRRERGQVYIVYMCEMYVLGWEGN